MILDIFNQMIVCLIDFVCQTDYNRFRYFRYQNEKSHNICSEEKRTKHTSILLLSLVRFYAVQTLCRKISNGQVGERSCTWLEFQKLFQPNVNAVSHNGGHCQRKYFGKQFHKYIINTVKPRSKKSCF